MAAGANPEILRGGIEKAVEVAVAAIKERAKEISGRGEISRVGAISARSEGGDTVGKLAEALDVEPSESFSRRILKKPIPRLARRGRS